MADQDPSKAVEVLGPIKSIQSINLNSCYFCPFLYHSTFSIPRLLPVGSGFSSTKTFFHSGVGIYIRLGPSPTELAVMDLDIVDFKHNCSEFDINGDCCDRCKSAFSLGGFRQILEPSPGFLHYNLATLKKREGDSCPLCRAILSRFKGSRLYRRPFREESVDVVLRIEARQKSNSLSQGSVGVTPMHVLSISLHSVEYAEVVQDINYELDIFAYEGLRIRFYISSS